MTHELQKISHERASGEKVVQESRELLAETERIYRDFIVQAHEKGMGQSMIQQAIIGAWNEGVLPRVVQGEEFRGSGIDVVTFDGQVPSDFFEDRDFKEVAPLVEDGKVNKGAWEDMRMLTAGKCFDSPLPDGDDPNAFRVEIGTLPQSPDAVSLREGNVLRPLERVRAALQAASYELPGTSH